MTDKNAVITIKNEAGMQVDILPLGATIMAIRLPMPCPLSAAPTMNIVLGYPHASDYQHNPAFMGATVGRYANRIAGAQFTLNDKVYSLTANEGNNQLHGGPKALDKQVWHVTHQQENRVALHVLSDDGDQGFPGNLRVEVTYTLSDDNALIIDYEAQSDQDTPLNLTDHSYFNLNGVDVTQPEKLTPITNHQLQIHADRYTQVDADSLPTGEFISVDVQPAFDFRTPVSLESRLIQGKACFDHNFVIGQANQTLSKDTQFNVPKVASAYSPATGVTLDVYTSKPGLQCYCGQFLEAPFIPNGGLCLETQYFPDSPNQPAFPSAVLHAGETYIHRTVYALRLSH